MYNMFHSLLLFVPQSRPIVEHPNIEVKHPLSNEVIILIATNVCNQLFLF
ncbi:hypothetical protein J2S16_001869 [Cytobacillus kochii]|nr:hypothetical protein [Cytobacillus kochii]